MVREIRTVFEREDNRNNKLLNGTVSSSKQVGFDSSLEFTSVEGDLSKEDEVICFYRKDTNSQRKTAHSRKYHSRKETC